MIDEQIRIRKLGNEHGYLSEKRTTGSRFSERVEKKVLNRDSEQGLERGLEIGLEQRSRAWSRTGIGTRQTRRHGVGSSSWSAVSDSENWL